MSPFDITPPDGMILIRSAPSRRSLRTALRAASGLSIRLSPQCGCDSSGSRPLEPSPWPPVGPSGVPETHIRGPGTVPAATARFSATITPVGAPTSRTVVKPAIRVARALVTASISSSKSVRVTAVFTGSPGW